MEEVELADQVGLDVFGVGEHHRPDFAVSAPAVVLAAAAERTVADPADQRRQRAVAPTTRCGSSRSSRRSTCSRAGGPRSWPGAGSFIESFPLFGYDLDDYDALFAEKLDLLLALRESERVTWSGRLRAPIDDRGVYPRPLQDPLPVWIAVGGTPNSVARAGLLGLPMALAIIGGHAGALRAARRAAPPRGAPRPATTAPRMSINSHGFVAETSQAGRRRRLPALRDDDEPHRPRARLGADEPGRLRRQRWRCAAPTSSAAPSR